MPPKLAQRLPVQFGNVLAVERDAARSKRNTAQHGPPEGRLARSALADKAQGLAPRDGHADVVHRVNVQFLLAPEPGARPGKTHRDTIGAHQWCIG